MRRVILFVGAWTDLGLEKFIAVAAETGYQGVELSFRVNIVDMDRVLRESAYRDFLRDLLAENGLVLPAINASFIGKCVGDEPGARLDGLAPPALRGRPDDIRGWALDSMLKAPAAAKLLGCDTVVSFLGSPVWSYFYPYPRRPANLVEDGFARIAALWLPILDEFSRQGVKLAFEPHPTEIAYDFYTTAALFEALGRHPAFKLNFDPSHLVWQGVDPAIFIREFGADIVHVHVKDVQVRLDGKSSLLASHLDFGDRRRGWDFRSPGRGQVPFEEIIRELNAAGYSGALSVEWEDNGMDRYFGARDALEFVKRLNFDASDIAFDSQPKFPGATEGR
jgi:sugar phosphate isomerase/epimerase